jgi:hypothetical protein
MVIEPDAAVYVAAVFFFVPRYDYIRIVVLKNEEKMLLYFSAIDIGQTMISKN